jgi:hypothetical protein
MDYLTEQKSGVAPTALPKGLQAECAEVNPALPPMAHR